MNVISRALALILLVAVVSSTTITVLSETFEKPPLLVYSWSYSVSGDIISSFDWSPKGDSIAVTVNSLKGAGSGKIVVLDSSGRVLWDSGDIGYPVVDVSWSSDAKYLTGITLPDYKLVVLDPEGNSFSVLEVKADKFSWRPGGDEIALIKGRSVKLVSVSGEIIWSYEVGYYTWDLAWSPDGELLAVATNSGVTVLYGNGSIAWSYSRESIRRIEWSLEGGLLAVFAKTSSSGGEVIVLSRRGEVLWSIRERIFYSMAWVPGEKLLVGGLNITLYSSGGEVLWSRRAGGSGGVFTVVSEYDLLWNPGDNNVTLVSGEKVAVIDLDSGEIVWSDRLVSSPIEEAGWSSSGSLLAVRTGSRLVVYSYGLTGYLAKIIVSATGCWSPCIVSFNDGKIVKEYSVSPGGFLKLYATPGNYSITFRAPVPPLNTVGDYLELLLNKTIATSIVVEAGGEYTVEAPVDRLREAIVSSLGKLVIIADPGTIVSIYWGGNGRKQFTVPDTGSLTIYVVPGSYRVSAELLGGLQKDLGSIAVSAGETKYVKIVSATTSRAQEQTTTEETLGTKTSAIGGETTSTATTTGETTTGREQAGLGENQWFNQLAIPLAIAVAVIILALTAYTLKTRKK